MKTWTEDIVTALNNLGGTASYVDLYEEIRQIRTDFPDSWQAVVRRNIQNQSSDSDGYKGGKDIFFSVDGLGRGVWGLRSHLEKTPLASDLPSGTETPGRAEILTYRVLRDTPLARKIKLLHENRCQLCGSAVQIGQNMSYAEAHHVIPLGVPHNGPDTPDNIIVLCPNHHVLCDYGAIRLDSSQIRVAKGHEISKNSIDYHNTKIWTASLSPLDTHYV